LAVLSYSIVSVDRESGKEEGEKEVTSVDEDEMKDGR